MFKLGIMQALGMGEHGIDTRFDAAAETGVPESLMLQPRKAIVGENQSVQ